MRTSSYFCLIAAFLLNAVGLREAAADGSWVEQYNVTWNTQSENSSGSMPLVGGNLGCNVWVEDNELLFYFSSPGCRDENGALLKFGRVRIETEPDIFAGADFEQKLNLSTGCIDITTRSKALGETRVKLWVEINSPIIHVDVDSESEVTVKAVYESWRHEPLLIPDHRQGNRFLPHYERSLAYTSRPGYEGDVFIYNDEFKPADESIQFVHRMRNDKCFFNEQVEQQELTAIKDKLYDPLTDLTFGGKLVGDGLRFVKETNGMYGQNPFKGWQYQTEKSKQARLKVITHIAQTKTLAEWEKQLDEKIEGRSDDQTAWQANLKWWDQFWARSRIVINADRGEKDEGWQLARNYNLFRYMLVSGFFANEPTMFNGGVLTFDAVHEGADRYGRPATTERERKKREQYGDTNVQAGSGFTPDFRRWGGALTAQNQRLVYWPMLKNGDFDGILPQLDWYIDILPSTKSVVQHYYGIDGCMNAEQPSIIGLIGMSEYGWTSKHTEGTNKYRAADFEKGIPDNGIGYIFQSQLEFSWMMLEYHRFSGKDISTYLPFIEQAVIFYDEYYRMWQKKLTGNELDGRKLMIFPSNALEGHRNSINPTSVIAGLTTVLNGLIALPDELQSEVKKKRWTAMLVTIPDYPYGFRNGKTYLRPAANKELGHKVHCPELYPLYPYQIYGLGMDNLDLIKNTMDVVVEKYPHYNQTSGGWNQNLIYYARMGDTETARTLTCDKIGNGPYRFPAFFPGGDYAPDHNVGGSGMIGLQEMLLQTHGDKIRLLPAWPPEWDVDFKLHAPGKTCVECSFKDGKIQSTNVSPLTRDSSIISFYRKDKATKGK